LTSKRDKTDAGELSPRSFEDYYVICDVLISHFKPDRRVDGLRADDFARLRKSMAKQWGPVRLWNSITRIRMVFKFAFDERLIEHPKHYGQSFAPPSGKTLRKARIEAGPRVFEASEIRAILDSADIVLRAMVLLGINCGFGNTDCANLPQSAVDFETRWCDFPRPMTGINRRVPLWTETIDALIEAIASRPNPKDYTDADCCFITSKGNRWVRVQPGKSNPDKFFVASTIALKFGRLVKRLDINGRRGFYALRHSFETVAGESIDQVAVNALMGHVDNSMAGVYRERISDERLKAVVDVVHRWLFPPTD
jgi:integrase